MEPAKSLDINLITSSIIPRKPFMVGHRSKAGSTSVRFSRCPCPLGGKSNKWSNLMKKDFAPRSFRPVHLPPVEKCNDLGSMDAALLKLNKMTPLAKRSFLDHVPKSPSTMVCFRHRGRLSAGLQPLFLPSWSGLG